MNLTILTIFAITVLILAVFNPKPFIAAWEKIKDRWEVTHPSDKTTLKVCLAIVLVLAVWAATEFI